MQETSQKWDSFRGHHLFPSQVDIQLPHNCSHFLRRVSSTAVLLSEVKRDMASRPSFFHDPGKSEPKIFGLNISGISGLCQVVDCQQY